MLALGAYIKQIFTYFATSLLFFKFDITMVKEWGLVSLHPQVNINSHMLFL